jgi:hypothetical protein
MNDIKEQHVQLLEEVVLSDTIEVVKLSDTEVNSSHYNPEIVEIKSEPIQIEDNYIIEEVKDDTKLLIPINPETVILQDNTDYTGGIYRPEENNKITNTLTDIPIDSIIDNLREDSDNKPTQPILTNSIIIEDNTRHAEDNYNQIFNFSPMSKYKNSLSRSSSILSEIKEDHLMNKKIISNNESFLKPEDYDFNETILFELENGFKEVENRYISKC